MKETFTRLWDKPWGKALIAALYSAVTILAYFALAQIAFALWDSTWLPSIGRRPMVMDAPTSVPEQAYHPIYYNGPGTYGYAASHPDQSAAPQVPVQQAPPVPDTSSLGPPPPSNQPN